MRFSLGVAQNRIVEQVVRVWSPISLVSSRHADRACACSVPTCFDSGKYGEKMSHILARVTSSAPYWHTLPVFEIEYPTQNSRTFIVLFHPLIIAVLNTVLPST